MTNPVTERIVVHRPATAPVRSTVRPAVSVVIPCFNYARFLPAAVASALDQDGVDVRVIVVDDASTDDSARVAHELAERDDRVEVLAHAANRGPVDTFNDGLARATGEHLVRLDADDLLTPGSLARSAALLEAWPSVGLVYGHPLHFTGELPTARTEVESWTIWPGREWLELRCRLGVNCITAPEVVMRASVVAEVGGQKDLAHTHDMEMWMRISAVSDVGHIEGADQAWHRDHDQSLSAREVDLLTDFHERQAAFDTLFDGTGGELPDAARLRAVAHRALAREALDRVNRAYDRGNVATSPIAGYLDFARALEPDLESLPEWRGLRARERWGPQRASRVPWFVAAALRRRLREDRARRAWHRTGV